LSILKIPTAKAFEPLLKPTRYKGVYGGRGSGKSHFFGELLVETCQAERGTLAVCIREAQRTLAQSSKRLIESKIASLGLGQGFRIFTDKIETPGDGVVIFRGMQDHTAESIKSLEGFRIAWIDEAQSLSARSLALLRPTIRAKDSELWASWNSLQLRFIRAVESRGRRNGWNVVVSDTTDNLVSANNFIRAGYKLFRPKEPWAWPHTLYWRKFLS
jgi:phage terminase large subunit